MPRDLDEVYKEDISQSVTLFENITSDMFDLQSQLNYMEEGGSNLDIDREVIKHSMNKLKEIIDRYETLQELLEKIKDSNETLRKGRDLRKHYGRTSKTV